MNKIVMTRRETLNLYRCLTREQKKVLRECMKFDNARNFTSFMSNVNLADKVIDPERLEGLQEALRILHINVSDYTYEHLQFDKLTQLIRKTNDPLELAKLHDKLELLILHIEIRQNQLDDSCYL